MARAASRCQCLFQESLRSSIDWRNAAPPRHPTTPTTSPNRDKLPRTAIQNGSAFGPAMPSRVKTCLDGGEREAMQRLRRKRPEFGFVEAGGRPRDRRPRSTSASSSCRDVTGRTADADPVSTAIAAMARASVPFFAQRGDRQGAGALAQAFTGGGNQQIVVTERRHEPAGPTPGKIWICTAVLVTWSSPRIMWVMPRSMSSTTDGRV